MSLLTKLLNLDPLKQVKEVEAKWGGVPDMAGVEELLGVSPNHPFKEAEEN